VNRYMITPSFGFTKCAARVFVAAKTPESAVEAAKLVTGRVGGFVPTNWPVALVSYFPKNALVVNAMS
jgi:hypothetical protein